MDIQNVGELSLISSYPLLSYVPICNDKGGYVSEEFGKEFKIKEFLFSVAKMTSETLTIEPYFVHKQFCVMYGACLNKLVVDSYGGTTTEMSYIKFTGESLDNLTGFLQKVKKDTYIACAKSGKDVSVEVENFFIENILRVVFEPKVNKRGNKYYACLFSSIPSTHPEFTKFLRAVSFSTPANIHRSRSLTNTAQSVASESSSASTSPSSSANVLDYDHEKYEQYAF